VTRAALVQLEAVGRRYPGPAGKDDGPEVLADVSLRVAAGESVAVVGPSGSGKSTLLNLIGALDRPTTGRVLLAGRDLAGLDELELARVRNTEVGFVFQSHHLLPQCTALENALVPTLVHPDAELRAGAEARARELLERVGLGGRADHRPAQLSGGERQRAAVVRALINRPRLLLADEPTGSLDGEAAARLADLLAELNASEGVTLVTVTHSDVLAARAGRVLRLESGRLVPAAQPAG
jgi:predicted ABC-type transport system involved in lysophospholipase L1 biosynthesis ATPase subunit